MRNKVILLVFMVMFSFIANGFAQNHQEGASNSSIVHHPAWTRNQTIYEINIRQFTPQGTFNAVIPRLKELKKMGIKTIWFMPITPIGKKNRKGKLGSYYSVQNYLKVNPNYGTLADFKHLVQSIHKLGMHVIIDWVADHTSWDNVLTKSHPDWYKHDKQGHFMPPVKDWTDVIALNYNKPGLRNYMINAMKYWVKETNIDGFRCDVASMVPIDFWIEARKQLDKIKPVFMLAEAESPKMHQAFDMTYSWSIYHLFNQIAKGKNNATAIDSVLKKEREAYPADAYRMRFITNHDENSWNGTVFERLGNGAKAFAVLTFTIKGTPLIYDGQEVGMHKRLKFFQKDAINWSDPHNYREFYTRLVHLKDQNKALLSGDEGGKMVPIANNHEKYVYTFVRAKNKNKVVVITNLSNKEQTVDLHSNKMTGTYRNLFNNKKVSLTSNMKMNLKPWEYKVYIK